MRCVRVADWRIHMTVKTTTKQLGGMRVVDAKKGKRIGKVRSFVFHPREKRCIGILVKRPDAALMFHRKDLFVALDGFHVEDDQIVVHDDPAATDKGAIKSLGVDWDSCVIWVGMPAVTKSGDQLGYISSVSFDAETGVVESFTTEDGAANDLILGKRVIPVRYIKGFRKGQGVPLVQTDDADADSESVECGSVLVADEALDVPVDGGAAAAAGKAAAVVTHKAKSGAARAKAAASEKAEKAKPVARVAARKTGEAVEAGSFAVGRQLGRASGMFAAFKEEFDKASKGEDS